MAVYPRATRLPANASECQRMPAVAGGCRRMLPADVFAP